MNKLVHIFEKHNNYSIKIQIKFLFNALSSKLIAMFVFVSNPLHFSFRTLLAGFFEALVEGREDFLICF